MGLVHENSLGGEWQGRFGNFVLAKFKPGIKIARRRPVRTKPRTMAEKACQSQFRDAVRWAKAVWVSLPELKAKYIAAARLKSRRGFELAKAYFLTRPVIQDINLDSYTGKAGERIQIRAVDAFELPAVELEIHAPAGTLIESGSAVFMSDSWYYIAQTDIAPGQAVTIRVHATDYPNRTTTRRIDHICGEPAV